MEKIEIYEHTFPTKRGPMTKIYVRLIKKRGINKEVLFDRAMTSNDKTKYARELKEFLDMPEEEKPTKVTKKRKSPYGGFFKRIYTFFTTDIYFNRRR